jgi:aminoglycoside phosphotransferase (APT) family kinase protein
MDIHASLVRKLVSEQFSQWADLPITPVELSGWDNTTFHLGEEMLVRLPSAARYAPQVNKEHRWLPRLASFLPLPIPVPLAKGVPSHGYPWQWSIYQWIEGERATIERIADLPAFAMALAQFLDALQRIDSTDGPPPGPHSFFRGAPLAVYDTETRHAIAVLDGQVDTDTTIMVILDETYLEIANSGPPLDLAPAELFERFKKSNGAANSLGLGLAIVKQICTVHNHQANYRYKAGQHIFTVEFN